MASVYTNDLRLEEIGSGEQSGAWGDTTNTNLELIAEAFAFGTEAITTNADTHATTIADGASDPGRSIFLKYTGTLDSACTITLGPNTVSKLWFIENGTSGSQNIIISQGSGANITIPAGQTKAVYSNGGGSGAVMVDAFATLNVVDLLVDDDLTVTDDVAIGGLATIGETLAVTGIVTASDDVKLAHDGAVLGFGAGNDVTLTHVHDTGLLLNSTMALQFNDASQFINAPSATVLDITATDEIELNATAIDLNGTLDVSGTALVTGVLTTTAATVFNGGFASNAASTITVGDNTAGLTLTCTDTDTAAGPILDLLRNAGNVPGDDDFMGLIRFRGDNTNTGEIHTFASVQAKAIDVSAATEDGRLFFNVVQGGALSEFARMEGGVGVIFNEDSNDIDFRVESNGNANMLFVDGGNDAVVIGHNDATNGTFASSQAFQVVGTSFTTSSVGLTRFSADANGPSISFSKSRAAGIGTDTVVQDDDSLGNILFTGADGTDLATQGATIGAAIDGTPGGNDMPTRLTFATTGDGNSSPTERMRIHQTGHVSIATVAASTLAKLCVNAVTDGGGAITGRSDGGNGNNERFVLTAFADGGGANYGGGFAFQTRGTTNTFVEAMRIDSSQNLLIGKTAVSFATAGIELKASDVISITRSAGTLINVNRIGSSAGTAIVMHYNGVDVGSIDVADGSTSYNTSSDYRLKTDAQPMTGATARLKQLNPVNFKWLSSGKRVDGFLAHEAQAVVPEAVTGTKDAMMDEEYEVSAAIEEVTDEDGNVTTEAVDAVMGTRSVPDMQGIDQSKLVPLLVKTILELEARITALEG